MLTQDAVLTMPPWVYWLDGRDAIVATMLSPGTWEGEPRPGRYRIVPCGMNGQPAALAYVRFGDGPYVAVCMTVMTLAPDGRICNMDTFVLPKQFTAWGYPPTLDPAVVRGHGLQNGSTMSIAASLSSTRTRWSPSPCVTASSPGRRSRCRHDGSARPHRRRTRGR